MSTHAKLVNNVAPSPASYEGPGHSRALVPIVRIVLTQAVRYRRRGAITEESFEAQLRRLEREELEPRGLELVMHDLPCGTTRFVVKAKATGIVCDMIDCSFD